MVIGLIGIAWSVASVFVVPVIVAEDLINPFEILKSSATKLKKTWGESVVGFLGLQFGGLLILFFSIGYWTILGFVGAKYSNGDHAGLILSIAGFFWIVSLFLYIYFIHVANHIYRCALFSYASSGLPPAPFTQTDLSLAWKMKK
jgi:hypothetical protein